MLQLIKLNHSFIKGNVLRLLQSNSINSKNNETISTINQINQSNNSYVINKSELIQSMKIKLMFEKIKNVLGSRLKNYF